MKRRIIRIDEEKCNGCGACAAACHEGAIAMVDGKARLTREDREAPAYDEAAVEASRMEKSMPCGCPGTQSRRLERAEQCSCSTHAVSRLSQWPVQIKLAPVTAPWFQGADVLVAATCTAYAYGAFHEDFIRGRVTLVGCPKLDGVDYSDKLAMIFKANDVASITLVRMEVPCCGGLEIAVRKAIEASGKNIPLRVVTISTDGMIL